MTVQSASYILFICVTWALFQSTTSVRARQFVLLAASYLFYGSWGKSYLALLIASSLMNYLLGAVLRRGPGTPRLCAGVGANILVLAVFKYLPPLASSDGWTGLLHTIVMPVGISFWTFQAISYLFDVYRGEDADPRLLDFLLYMAFWPTVLAGPVCRLTNLLPQFRRLATPGWNDFAEGAHRIVIGLFLKTVLAESLQQGFGTAEGVAYGFDQIRGGWGGIDVILLAVGFGLQLYFDFAGYSHIVIGTARLFAVRLEENFDRPYLCTSPSAFWTRWHMSLSFWIRDYVFLPMAMRQGALWWRYLALLLSMVVFGIWHGLTWPFVLWGGYHGLLLVAHRQWQQIQRRLNWALPAWMIETLGWAATFAAVSLGWIFFRAHNLDQVWAMFGALVSPASYHRLVLVGNFYFVTPAIILGYFVFSGAASLLRRSANWQGLSAAFRVLSPVFYSAAIVMIIIWSKGKPPFIYFQF